MSLYPSYARPASLKQAVDLLESLSAGATVIAGGQEIMPFINYGTLAPSVYVDINGLPELKGVSFSNGVLSIGALTVHRELIANPLVQANAPLLAASISQAGGGRQVHNRATLGGNIVAQHPLYDLTPSLLALGAEVEVAKGAHRRILGLAALLKETSHGLGSQSLLVRVLVPAMPSGTGWAYEKLKSSGGAYGSANAAAVVSVAAGKIATVNLAIGAVSERVIDAGDAASAFIGQAWDDSFAADLATRVSSLVKSPLSDQQGPGEWRRAMAGVVAARAVAAAVAKAS
jgi:aerobic carbon-monoxide dehydrogenase medium subunit